MAVKLVDYSFLHQALNAQGQAESAALQQQSNAEALGLGLVRGAISIGQSVYDLVNESKMAEAKAKASEQATQEMDEARKDVDTDNYKEVTESPAAGTAEPMYGSERTEYLADGSVIKTYADGSVVTKDQDGNVSESKKEDRKLPHPIYEVNDAKQQAWDSEAAALKEQYKNFPEVRNFMLDQLEKRKQLYKATVIDTVREKQAKLLQDYNSLTLSNAVTLDITSGDESMRFSKSALTGMGYKGTEYDLALAKATEAWKVGAWNNEVIGIAERGGNYQEAISEGLKIGRGNTDQAREVLWNAEAAAKAKLEGLTSAYSALKDKLPTAEAEPGTRFAALDSWIKSSVPDSMQPAFKQSLNKEKFDYLDRAFNREYSGEADTLAKIKAHRARLEGKLEETNYGDNQGLRADHIDKLKTLEAQLQARQEALAKGKDTTPDALEAAMIAYYTTPGSTVGGLEKQFGEYAFAPNLAPTYAKVGKEARTFIEKKVGENPIYTWGESEIKKSWPGSASKPNPVQDAILSAWRNLYVNGDGIPKDVNAKKFIGELSGDAIKNMMKDFTSMTVDMQAADSREVFGSATAERSLKELAAPGSAQKYDVYAANSIEKFKQTYPEARNVTGAYNENGRFVISAEVKGIGAGDRTSTYKRIVASPYADGQSGVLMFQTAEPGGAWRQGREMGQGNEQQASATMNRWKASINGGQTISDQEIDSAPFMTAAQKKEIRDLRKKKLGK